MERPSFNKTSFFAISFPFAFLVASYWLTRVSTCMSSERLLSSAIGLPLPVITIQSIPQKPSVAKAPTETELPLRSCTSPISFSIIGCLVSFPFLSRTRRLPLDLPRKDPNPSKTIFSVLALVYFTS